MPYKDPEDQRRYAREHYLANRELYIERATAHNKIRRKNLRDIINAAKSIPCTDCGKTYPPYIMQFDHINDDKEDNVSTLVANQVALAKILAEIAKCEVVCANCHAERTHRRSRTAPTRVQY